MLLKMSHLSFFPSVGALSGVSSQVDQQREPYQKLLLALWPEHREVDHRSNHQHHDAEHEDHQLLPILLQHAADDVVDAEHCREQTITQVGRIFRIQFAVYCQ